ncbi:MAG: HEAT repeat domain-containing protein [Desulfohalobiaceae bacterium]
MSETQTRTLGGRRIKSHIYQILQGTNWQEELRKLQDIPARRLISPLFGTLCAGSDLLRWRGISSFGLLLPRLIQEQGLEAARVVLRRLTWSLNDESGGIGWGAPEAMAEILAGSEQLALEYHKILLSFINPAQEPGNYLEYLPLRRGAYWGLARLAQANPQLLATQQETLIHCLRQEEDDPFILACGALLLDSLQPGPNALQELLHRIQRLGDTELEFFWNGQLFRQPVLQLAGSALDIGNASH